MLSLIAGPPIWVRGQSRLNGQQIELDPATLEQYTPFEEGLGTQLLFALAAVRTPPDALTVASAFGLLYAGPDATRYTEPFSQWARVARELQAALDMYAALAQARAGDQASAEARVKPLLARGRSRLDAQTRTYLEGYEPLAQASLLVATIISNGLAGVSESLVAAVSLEQHHDGYITRGEPGYFFFGPQLDNLAGLAYHTLALTVANQVELLRCPQCNTTFVPNHGNQKYCKKACMNLANTHRYRNQHGTQNQSSPLPSGPGLDA